MSENGVDKIKVDSSSSESTETSSDIHHHIENEDELLVAVKKQIEYYFSKENLLNDSFLASQMDANKSVAISTIMKFAKLKSLTNDEAIIKKSLQDSLIVTVVDDRIRVNTKNSGRSTIILREIPDDATEEEIREIFNFEGCRPVQSMRKDIENTWFVVMECEDDVKDTVLDLQVKKRLFRGDRVKVRVKTETSVRSFYPVQPVPIAPVIFPNFPGFSSGDARQFNGSGSSQSPVSDSKKIDAAQDLSDNNSDRKAASRSSASYNTQRSGKDHERKSSAGSNRRDGRRGPAGKDRKDGGNGSGKVSLEIDSINFPPLSQSDESPVPSPGFKGDVVKYSIDEVINIVKNLQEAHLPDEIRPENHPLAMSVEANKDLLLRQRTFSIDETREQLQQGRPVQRLAVSYGPVDYGSMMYGDGYQQNTVDHRGDADSAKAKAPSAASWAALVKSTSDAVPPKAAAPVAPKVESKPNSKGQKNQSKSNSANESNSNENAKEPNGKVEKKRSSEKHHQERKNESVENVTKSSHVESKTENDSENTKSNAKTTAWGGKPTFANILKQSEPVSVPPANAHRSKSDKSTSASDSKKGEANEKSKKSQSRAAKNAGGSGMHDQIWRRATKAETDDASSVASHSTIDTSVENK